ncbi:MAG: hypothetical protein IJ794_00220 [Lachnospiraceae bacterium]|nr:hypothetical protein [Lachnospiraceae bacterium]
MYEITEYKKHMKNGTEHGYKVHLREYVQEIYGIAIEEGLNLDARDLIVKFAGGNLVCIWNSEWGGIRNEEVQYVQIDVV